MKRPCARNSRRSWFDFKRRRASRPASPRESNASLLERMSLPANLPPGRDVRNLHWALRMARRQLTEARSDVRRQDAREKIELGGLIVKAGLRESDRAAILGLLIDGAVRMTDPDEYERLRRIGTQALEGKP